MPFQTAYITFCFQIPWGSPTACTKDMAVYNLSCSLKKLLRFWYIKIYRSDKANKAKYKPRFNKSNFGILDSSSFPFVWWTIQCPHVTIHRNKFWKSSSPLLSHYAGGVQCQMQNNWHGFKVPWIISQLIHFKICRNLQSVWQCLLKSIFLLTCNCLYNQKNLNIQLYITSC